jgi:hypothetical protein
MPLEGPKNKIRRKNSKFKDHNIYLLNQTLICEPQQTIKHCKKKHQN